MDALNVSAIIVTKGDQDLWPIIWSLPEDWQIVVWDNGHREVRIHGEGQERASAAVYEDVADEAVYGRYAAIEYAAAELIYVQDDDCVVSDPQAIVRKWDLVTAEGDAPWPVVCNMPQEFRHDFYEDHALVGFGAAFHRDAPARAFARWDNSGAAPMVEGLATEMEWFRRTCDIVFTGLTPRVLVDVPHEDLPWAHYEDRMWKQPQHQAERVRMLELVRQIA